MFSNEDDISAASVRAFHNDGYVTLENVFHEQTVIDAFQSAVNNFEEALSIINVNKLDFGIGIKNGFKEIVQRHPCRYEMPYKMGSSEFDFVLENEQLRGVIGSILECNDFTVVNRSLVISMPNCTDQGWHADGPHVSVNEHLPCHVLNVFVPLVDVDMSNGPTEFRPASHHMTRGDLAKAYLLAFMKKTIRKPECPSVKKGSVLLFDYRVLHRGRANLSNNIRPILVFTFAKPWYKDLLNFPHRSLFEAATATQVVVEKVVEEGEEGK